MAGNPPVWLTPLHRVEWAHAIAQHVFLKKISTAEALRFQNNMEKDRQSGQWLEVEMPPLVWEYSVDLARRHCSLLGTRTLDTLHVATALELKAEHFWTFDDRQIKLAHAVGLKTS